MPGVDLLMPFRQPWNGDTSKLRMLPVDAWSPARAIDEPLPTVWLRMTADEFDAKIADAYSRGRVAGIEWCTKQI